MARTESVWVGLRVGVISMCRMAMVSMSWLMECPAMDSMEGKVGQITGRMSEVDDNLNYLLGRLSLVTQEFNQIKSGLGQALDSIKSSFKAVSRSAALSCEK